MQETIEQLSASIESLKVSIEALKETKSIFDAYVFPITSAFLSAIFGGIIAYFAVTRQESTKIEKEKMKASNKCLLVAEKAFTSLLAVKRNYYERVSINPIQRVMAIRVIAGTKKQLEFDSLTLIFITPEKESEVTKWNQVTQIDTMFQNYNELIEIWKKFEEVSLPLKHKVIEKYTSKAVANISDDQVLAVASNRDLSIASDLAERALRLTDNLLVDFHDFIGSFPQIAKSRINTGRLKRYGKVLETKGRGTKIDHLLKRVTEVDMEAFAALLGVPLEEARQRIAM